MLTEHKIQQMAEISSHQYWLTIGIVLLVLVFLSQMHGDRRVVVSSLLLGALTSALYTFEPQWTPSVFFYDLSRMFWAMDEGALTVQRVAVFGMLLLGMLVYTLKRRTFCYQRLQWLPVVRHLLGGNDSQILLVFPTMTWVGAVPLAAIVLGVLVGGGGRGVWRRRNLTLS